MFLKSVFDFQNTGFSVFFIITIGVISKERVIIVRTEITNQNNDKNERENDKNQCSNDVRVDGPF